MRKDGDVTEETPPSTREVRVQEEALEPVALIEQSGAVVRTGLLMLASGTASYRVKEAMAAVATALGIDRPRYHVSFTDIASTSHRGRIFRTRETSRSTPVWASCPLFSICASQRTWGRSQG